MKLIRLLLLLTLVFLIKNTNGQSVTGIYTDFGGYWHSRSTLISTTRPDSSHNLLAFTYNGTNYSTNVNNAVLTSHGIPFVASEYKALPVLTIAVPPTTSTVIGFGYRLMGVGNASTVSVTLDFPKYLTDGLNGLDLGTTVFNQPVSDISYKISDFNIAKIGDNIPDIIVTQMGDPSGSSDSFRFVDAFGNTVGNAVVVRFTDIVAIGSAQWKFYTTTGAGAPVYHPSLNTTGGASGYRDIRLRGFDLSEFGLNSSNVPTIARFVHKLGGNSDQAFIAYNTSSFEASNNYQPGCITELPKIWLRADNLTGLNNLDSVFTWVNAGTVSESMVRPSAAAKVPTYRSGANTEYNYNPFIKTNGNGLLRMSNPIPNTYKDSSMSIFIVAKTNVTTGNNRIFGMTHNAIELAADNFNFPSLGFVGLNTNFAYNASPALSFNSNNTNGNKQGLITIEYNKPTNLIQLFRNGVSDGSNTYNMTIGHWNAQIGGAASNVDIAEIIYYTGRLEATDKSKVETYLAIKYGLTLNKNYLSGNNSTLWDYTANSAFNNNIIGIGREDCQRLHQKQSLSTIDATNRLIVGLGAVEASVASNPNGFTYDAHYAIFGENTGSLTAITSAYIKGQCLKYTARQWMVQRTGADIPNVNTQVRIKVNDIIFGETTGATQFLLIIDRNNNGSYNDSSDEIITSSSYSGGYAVFNNVKWSTISGTKARFTVGIKKPPPANPSVSISNP